MNNNPPILRVLEAQFIQNTKQIMHRVQVWMGRGKEPIILWLTIEEWRVWSRMPPCRIPNQAKFRQEWMNEQLLWEHDHAPNP